MDELKDFTVEASDSEPDEDENSVVLTERDIEIFKFIHEQSFVVHSHLRHGFWFNKSEISNACQRRKLKLLRAGFLGERYSKVKGKNVYHLTQKSFDEIKKRNLDSGLSLYIPTDDFDRNIDHDLKVTNIRILLGKIGLANWTSERMLKEGKASMLALRIPDGVLTVKGYKIAIEFENLITKGTKRYREIFADYAKDDRFLLLFMVIDADKTDWLVKREPYDSRKVWFVGTRELFMEKSRALMHNKRASFELGKIARVKHEKEPAGANVSQPEPDSRLCL